MAIVRIDFSKNQPADFAHVIAMTVNAVMQKVLNIPAKENFVVCQRHEVEMLLHDPDNVDAERLSEIVFIQITLNQGRTPELKSAFFATLNRTICEATSLRSDDVYINLIEVARENWAFGRVPDI